MKSYLNSLYIDLDNRLTDMIAHLEDISMENVSASTFKNTAIIHLNELKDKVAQVLNSGILEEEFFLPNALVDYNSLNNEYLELELFQFLPISRYDSQADGYFQVVIAAIYDEIGSLQSVPFVSCISNSDSYFWAYSKYRMIAVPQGEDKHLLHLSDLYHEAGHHLYIQHDNVLAHLHRELVESHFDKILKPLRRSGGDKKKNIKKAKDYWHNSWSEELVCDMIAAYLVGPAYAWTNMKSSTVSNGINAIYSNTQVFRDHPSDEVRMRAIFAILELEGYDAEVAGIKIEWSQFLSIAENDKPPFYEQIFPDELITELALQIRQACHRMALQSYRSQCANHTRPISLIINDAWHKIRNTPREYAAWQKEQITNIRSLGY